ncbi:MAG: DUF354 domain-containing protein [Bacteroidales bacterium]|nr:DUF354 domain-containing protein [Bacteroidales bacterium]
MNILFYLGHPAHFHLFKNVIASLSQKGHKIDILIKKKDILEELLQRSGMRYHNILPEGRSDRRTGIAIGMLKRDWRLFKFCIARRPDLLIGTSVEIGHVGTLLRIPSLNVNEDDAHAVPLYAKLSYPWSTWIISPTVCNNAKWEKKSVKYEGYHELAYLHPDHFKPSLEIVRKYIPADRSYFLMRFSGLKAYHDRGVGGINNRLASGIISLLKPHGEVYITSERELEEDLEPYRLNIDPLEIHHIIAYASMFIGDSQTMAAEAGVLGVPFVRYNDFVGRLGYLEELEKKYNLGFGMKPGNESELIETIKNILGIPGLRDEWQKRRMRMLKDKVNVAEFLVRVIEGFPDSIS